MSAESLPSVPPPPAASVLDLVLITGMAGSGKSVALNAMEDSSYYCVDNLPPELLESFVDVQIAHGQPRVAVVVDARSAEWLALVPVALERLRARGVSTKLLFLDATTETLLRRYSETRRRHPLTRLDTNQVQLALSKAITLERELLSPLRELAHVIDTSTLRASQLQGVVKNVVSAPEVGMIVALQSFAYKRGIPVDADFVFDVRMLPNPFYEPGLRHLTGMDEPVKQFLSEQSMTQLLIAQLTHLLHQWIPPLSRTNRAYVTVAVGCTGGQHRSVFVVESLHKRLSENWVTIKRHRELEAAGMESTSYMHTASSPASAGGKETN